MPTSNISKKVAAEKPSIESLDSNTQDVMERLRAIEEAEQRVVEQAIPEGKRLLMEKGVRIDRHNVRRFLVKLTPSMCRKENCGYDAAIEAGYKNGWNDDRLHPELVLPNGQTLEEAITRLLDYHERTSHAFSNSHIITEEEALRRKQYANVPGQFLTNPARS